MSKKREKKILKLLKAQRTPKRIAGVKVPKSLRRWSDSQLGAVVIAQMALNAGALGLSSPVGAKLRGQAEKVTRRVMEFLGGMPGGFNSRMDGAGKEKPKHMEDRAH